jgi:LPS sulfotransferase NodH
MTRKKLTYSISSNSSNGVVSNVIKFISIASIPIGLLSYTCCLVYLSPLPVIFDEDFAAPRELDSSQVFQKKPKVTESKETAAGVEDDDSTFTRGRHLQITRHVKIASQDASTNNNNNNNKNFLLVADARSGSTWVMNTLNHHKEICASGDFSMDSLSPEVLEWLPPQHKQCSFAYIRDQIISKNVTLEENCNDDNSALCNFIRTVQHDTSPANMLNVWTEAFLQSHTEQNRHELLLDCQCPTTSVRSGLKMMGPWISKLEPQSFNSTPFYATKMIRLHRNNRWGRFMSYENAHWTGHWGVHSYKARKEHLQAIQEKTERVRVNIEHLFGNMRWQQDMDQQADEWAKRHASQILWLEYEQCHEHPLSCFQAMFQFLGVTMSAKMLHSMSNHLGASFAQLNGGTALLQNIENPEEVKEALSANGFGEYVGVKQYRPIQYLIYETNTQNSKAVPHVKGIQVRHFGDTELNNTTNTNSDNRNKWKALNETLKRMHPETIVVVSSHGSSSFTKLNFQHLQKNVYGAVAYFRSAFATYLRQFPRAVVASSTAKGSTAESKKRKLTQTMQQTNQSDDSQSNHDMVLQGTFLAGTSRDLLRMIENLQINENGKQNTDDRTILLEYMKGNPNLLVLDYNQNLFGEALEDPCPSDDNMKNTQQQHDGRQEPRALFLHRQDDAKKCKAYEYPSIAAQLAYPLWKGNELSVNPVIKHIDRFFVDGKSLANIQRYFGPEILYVVDSKGVFASNVTRDRYRIKPTERLLRIAHAELMKEENRGLARWKSLQEAMNSEIGFPYWSWYGDLKSCNFRNAGFESVPVFTTCALSGCNHSFPMPAYMTFIDSQPATDNWYEMFNRFDKDYSWESKINKVVWRGSLSESDPEKVFDSARWRLCKKVHEFGENQKSLFDVGMTSIPEFLTKQVNIDASLIGGIVEDIGAMNDFQRYKAILDMDGNSWSSRFGTLLCYNSVAVKVEPEYVDYFYHDLVPWKHYVPVKADLSDLTENIEFILDPKHDHIARSIVKNANEWCSERFTHIGLAHDVLDIWEIYLQMLNKGDPNWATIWATKKMQVFSDNSGISLVQLDDEILKEDD